MRHTELYYHPERNGEIMEGDRVEFKVYETERGIVVFREGTFYIDMSETSYQLSSVVNNYGIKKL